MSDTEEDPGAETGEVLPEEEAEGTEGGAEGGGEAEDKCADADAAEEAEEAENAEVEKAEEVEEGEGGGDEDQLQMPEEDSDKVSRDEELHEEETIEGTEEDREEEEDWREEGEEEEPRRRWEEEDDEDEEEDEMEEGDEGPAEAAVQEAADRAMMSPAAEAVEIIAKKAGAAKMWKQSDGMGLDDLDDAGGLAAVQVAVLVAAAGDADEVVLEEDRTRYVWEGPCSSSSEEDVGKKKKRRRAREGEEEEEEEEELGETVTEEGMSREECLEEYRALLAQRPLLVKKNTLLQKKIHEYCKKRKMEVYFEEVERPDPKMLAKYVRQLEAFDDHLRKAVRTRAEWDEQLQRLEEQKAERTRVMRQNLETLLDAERGVGYALLSGTTGKPLQEKAVEKLLQRQEALSMDLHAVRLRFIRLRDALAVNEALMKRLETDTLGEGLYLLDYEQLRMENQSYSDKIEERDEELTRLRNKATASIQQLAHIREKANATAANITDLYDRLEQIDRLANETREDMGRWKLERDTLRVQYQSLRKEAGLLVHKRLLRDFERSLAHSDAMAQELLHLKTLHARQHKRLTRVKEALKELSKNVMGAGYKGRPLGDTSVYDVYRAMLAERRQTLASTLEEPSAEPRKTVISIKREQPAESLFKRSQLVYTRDKRRSTFHH